MDAEVVDIAFAYPDRASAGPSDRTGRKPCARIALILGQGGERSLTVPVRAARLIEEQGIAVPCSLDDAHAAISAVEGRMCYSVLVEMLSRRDHSVFEARHKLLACGYSPQEVDAALERAKDARFLDDARFTQAFVQERLRRGWGRRKIEIELGRRGVDAELCNLVLDGLADAEDEASRAREVLGRRPIPSSHPYERMVRSLVSKGFSYRVATDAARGRLEEEGVLPSQ